MYSVFTVMSDAHLDPSPSRNTRSRDYSRKPLNPISDRMSGKNLNEVTKSPKQNRKLKSGSSNLIGKSPKADRKQQKNKLYPNLPGCDDDYDAHDRDTEEDEDLNDSSRTDEADYDENEGTKSKFASRRGKKSPTSRGKGTPLYPSLNEAKDPPSRTKRNESSQKSGTLIYILIAIVIVCVGVAYFSLQTSEQKAETKTEEKPSIFELFLPKFDKIKAKYPSQTQRFWRIIGSQMRRLLTEKEETYPAVVLLGVSIKDSEIGTCFSSDVVSALNDVYNSASSGYIDISKLMKSPDDAAMIKLSLDEQLILNLENGRGVVLDHIEKLPAQAALLLHGYCDGDNAPYKQSAMFLGLHTKEVSKDQRDVDSILNELWEKELGSDEMPALRSRVGNSVAILSNEPNFKC